MLRNPFAGLTKREWLLWGMSMITVLAANGISGVLKDSPDSISLIASCIGVTALLLVARGDVWGQVLTVVFAVLYGVAAWRVRYWGEILTYMGMSAPMAVMAVVTWLKNPYDEKGSEVKIHKMNGRQKGDMFLSAAVVTGVFYCILKALDTPNLFFSTLSVTTSYLASYLTWQRSAWYGFAYAGNDLVLIVLWILASMQDITNLPMIACFVMFFLNDMYGFVSWRKREQKQHTEEETR